MSRLISLLRRPLFRSWDREGCERGFFVWYGSDTPYLLSALGILNGFIGLTGWYLVVRDGVRLGMMRTSEVR